MAEKNSARWSDAELRACLTAYLSMQAKQKLGIAFVKSQVHRKLQSEKRTAKSIEYRMQNLSSLMIELCLPVVRGYRPAGNLGSGVRARILAMMVASGDYHPRNYTPTIDDEELVEKSEILHSIDITVPPDGILKPSIAASTKVVYARDPKTRAWVLKNSNGICEGCGQVAPFISKTGVPFLEIHHVHRLADKGSDRISNAVALCPNCHRRCHESIDREAFTESLYQKIKRLKREKSA
ncbi:HNH endonuclease [Pseudomonas capsici]|uniref:HNH endonuclease n=1 Tax=Pseudomonas capsici TaxID=2810614 RepID=UPI0021F2445A|nr:HNH endonuclease [Pseudomonas capsici]MCV4285720.1 HNH endonuclease [Pseudomonas capsici]